MHEPGGSGSLAFPMRVTTLRNTEAKGRISGNQIEKGMKEGRLEKPATEEAGKLTSEETCRENVL